jgi:hypothetical protein
MNPISSAASGLLNAGASYNAASGNIIAAAANGGGGDMAAAIVGQAEAGVQLQAAANVQKVSDQMTATLLDITV